VADALPIGKGILLGWTHLLWVGVGVVVVVPQKDVWNRQTNMVGMGMAGPNVTTFISFNRLHIHPVSW